MVKQPKNKWYAFVPNLITTFNLLCGASGLYFAFTHRIDIAFFLMATGALFDFADGLAARLLKVSSELGKQLDSLADVITFGLLPGAMVFSVQYQIAINNAGSFDAFSFLQLIFVFSPLVIPALSAIRLAKFNIDTRQSHSFIGLPTPANALFFASLTYSATYTSTTIGNMASNPIILLLLTLLFSYLLIAELPLFALKFKSLNIKENFIRYVFLLLSALVIIFLKIPGIALVVLLYILLSIFGRKE